MWGEGWRVEGAARVGVHRVSSSLLGPTVPSFRALAGLFKFTVRRHNFNKDLHVLMGGEMSGRDVLSRPLSALNTCVNLLDRNVQRFRGGLVFKADRLCASTISRLELNTKEKEVCIQGDAKRERERERGRDVLSGPTSGRMGPESDPPRAVHLSCHKWPGGLVS